MDANFTNINNELVTKLPSATYTAADVLSKLITVDGVGSGLDADLLDGLNTSTTLPVPADKSSVVSRDASGNFSANLITATVTTANNLNGNASNGFISRIAVGSHTARTITGTGSDITIANGDGVSGNPTISAGTNLPKKDSANTYTLLQSFALITANAISNDASNNLFTGVNNLSTTSTNGFIYVPIITGTPTGVPTANSGRSPAVWDATGNRLWIYSGSVWNPVGSPFNGGTVTNDIIVPDEVYDATAWNGNLEVPTKNAVRDKIESLVTTTNNISQLNTSIAVTDTGTDGKIIYTVDGVIISEETDVSRASTIDGGTSLIPHFHCRAWAKVLLTAGVPSLSAGGNISSITDNGAGDYTLNFTTDMPDANYAIIGNARAPDTNTYIVTISEITAPTASAVRVKVESQSSTNSDPLSFYVAIFR